MRLPLLLIILLAGAVLPGCEASFDPFEESDLSVSMFGYLDTAADTQFVRVSLIRTPAVAGKPLDATVRLEDLGTGATVVLRDSLYTYTNGGLAYNVWTDTPIAADAAYRLTATRPDGAVASVVIRTPPTFPNPQIDSGIVPFSTSIENPPRVQQISFTGIERLADVWIRYTLSDAGRIVTRSYLDQVVYLPDGRISLAFNAYESVQEVLTGTAGQGCPGLLSAQIFVAATTADWPEVLNLDPETLAFPGVISNVEGGLGYVGAIETRSHIWEAMPSVFFFHRGGCTP